MLSLQSSGIQASTIVLPPQPNLHLVDHNGCPSPGHHSPLPDEGRRERRTGVEEGLSYLLKLQSGSYTYHSCSHPIVYHIVKWSLQVSRTAGKCSFKPGWVLFLKEKVEHEMWGPAHDQMD